MPGFFGGTGGDYPSRYHGFNPRDPVTDILSNTLGSNPLGQAAGNITPLLKVPIELSSGSILATGSKLPPLSEYADSQVPGLGPLSQILNKSIVGGGQDQQDVQKGYQNPGVDKIALFNYLSGLGVKDYSKPNYISGAEQEILRRARGN